MKRIVHTSSIAAVLNANKPGDTVFTESDKNTWSSVANGDAYGYAKITAEEIVDSYASKTEGLDCVSINPCFVVGPCMTKAHTKGSAVFVRELIYRNEQPDIYMQFVDVREVASAHVEALKRSDAAGKRFILAGSYKTHAMRVNVLGDVVANLYPHYNMGYTAQPFWKTLPLAIPILKVGVYSHYHLL